MTTKIDALAGRREVTAAGLTWQKRDPISAQTCARLQRRRMYIAKARPYKRANSRQPRTPAVAIAQRTCGERLSQAAIKSPHGGFRTEFRGETNVSAEQARA